MNPCPIPPLSLEAFASCSSQVHDELSLFNRMLAIANSPIDGFFYGMHEDFEVLEVTLGWSFLERPLGRTFGEAASCVSCLCEDRGLYAPSDWPAPLPSEAPYELSSQARSAILTFLRPLTHLALRCHDEEASIPFSQWKPMERCVASSLANDRLTLDEYRQGFDYFAYQGSTKKGCSPEMRVMNAFSFASQSYRNVVADLCGSRFLLDEALRPFDDVRYNLLELTYKLVRTSKRCGDPVRTGSEYHVDFPDPTRVKKAYESLYLLFIRPYAFLFEEHESCLHYRETVSHCAG